MYQICTFFPQGLSCSWMKKKQQKKHRFVLTHTAFSRAYKINSVKSLYWTRMSAHKHTDIALWLSAFHRLSLNVRPVLFTAFSLVNLKYILYNTRWNRCPDIARDWVHRDGTLTEHWSGFCLSVGQATFLFQTEISKPIIPVS